MPIHSALSSSDAAAPAESSVGAVVFRGLSGVGQDFVGPLQRPLDQQGGEEEAEGKEQEGEDHHSLLTLMGRIFSRWRVGAGAGGWASA